MAHVAELWAQALPDMRKGVTGVGVWAALNSARAIALEDGVVVVGLPHGSAELSGHLRLATTKRVIETEFSKVAGHAVVLRVIDGVDQEDWELAKRKDAEVRRLQELSLAKMRAELAAKVSWEAIYEQLSRRYAEITNKTLPQNRARFLESAISIVVEARREQANWDEMGERNFARCLERIAQYTEIPSALIASEVLKRAGEL